ncbi:MAG: CBS domain-containing protein [Dehalococcoidia bacterium]
MRVREFMTTNVISVSSKTPVLDAQKYMSVHRIRRLPVVDKGKVQGIVSDRRIAAASPSAATSLSVWEINNLMSKLTVGEIMSTPVYTVSQDTTAESALAFAQDKGIGSLPVVDDKNRLVGIVTTNDFVYRIMNPLLGIGKPGARLHIFDCGKTQNILEVIQTLNDMNLQVEAVHVDDSIERDTRDLIVQVDMQDASELIRKISNLGYSVDVRER